jgi:cytochrome c oxidase assembly factor CtaG
VTIALVINSLVSKFFFATSSATQALMSIGASANALVTQPIASKALISIASFANAIATPLAPDADAFPFASARDAILHGWSLPPFLTLVSVITLVIYLRGWRRGHALRPTQLPAWRAFCFCSGVAAFWLAIASPIGVFDDILLTAHMIQHLTLMSIAPPLILLGAPQVPLLRGLPRPLLQNIFAPLLRSKFARSLAHFLFHPITAWLALNIAFIGWHIPPAYELALHSETWHEVEHLCFFSTSIVFWWTVIQPWPSRPHFAQWKILPYLLTADFVNTALSAFFTFGGRVFYPSYATAPRLFSLSALNDQIAAGALMWVFGSLIYLVPLVAIIFRMVARNSPAHT